MRTSVNHPAHYKAGNIEVIDVIEQFELDFCLGNVVKCILRAGLKATYGGTPAELQEAEMEDLQKAQWYLIRHMQNVAANEQPKAGPSTPEAKCGPRMLQTSIFGLRTCCAATLRAVDPEKEVHVGDQLICRCSMVMVLNVAWDWEPRAPDGKVKYGRFPWMRQTSIGAEYGLMPCCIASIRAVDPEREVHVGETMICRCARTAVLNIAWEWELSPEVTR